MTRIKFKNYWQSAFKCSHGWRKAWQRNSFYLKGCLLENFSFQQIDFDFPQQCEDKRARMEKDLGFFIECVFGRKVDPSMISTPYTPKLSSYQKIMFGNCKTATPTPVYFHRETEFYQEKGNNPMRVEYKTPTATSVSQAPAKSVEIDARDHLLSRLSIYETWRNPKLRELAKFFKTDEDGKPKTYQQLIDAIKNDKFSLDTKVVKRLERLQEEYDEDGEDDMSLADFGYGPLYGLIFTDLPKADHDGYSAAALEFEGLVKATKDTIMVASPADGLKALQALEAWMPTGKVN